MLNFKDSERESVLSYFVKNGISNDFAAIDTPTRLLNKSNEFLPITYDEKLKRAVDEMEKQNEIDMQKRKKRTKSVQITTPRHEIKQQKDKLEDLISALPMKEL